MANIVNILNVFYRASGLKINIKKSNVFGVGVISSELDIMANQTGCLVGSLPFKYPGLPLDHRYCSVCCLEFAHKRLTNAQNGAFVGVCVGAFVFEARADFCIVNNLESIRLRFFWGGSSESSKMAWVRWEQILASLEKGGLNIGSLKAFNMALLMKWKWRFLSKPEALWVRIIKDIYGRDGTGGRYRLHKTGVWGNIVDVCNSLNDTNIIPHSAFKKVIGNGLSTRLWKEVWVGESTLASRFERIFRLDINNDCLIADRLIDDVWHWNWSRPLQSSRHLTEFEDLISNTSLLVLNDKNDSWSFSLAMDGVYMVNEGRRLIDATLLPISESPTRWLNTIPRKVNIFLWRVALDKLPTRLNLSKRGLEMKQISCLSCNYGIESLDHALFGCPIAKQVWSRIQLWTNVGLPGFDNWLLWIAWLDNWATTTKRKEHAYSIVAAYMWIM
ncbi:uncharacterized protein [Rutidosis leptorrhynchoides]|uniref:uncharacterized protein n=1 Tax=Rutidosis leptorrhynchoides TaxID=125765 RepID=UPI003A9A0BC7